MAYSPAPTCDSRSNLFSLADSKKSSKTLQETRVLVGLIIYNCLKKYNKMVGSLLLDKLVININFKEALSLCL
jgi:hypothetical protein